MNKILILFIGVSVIFMGVCFFATSNLICTICVGVLSILYFTFLAYREIKKYNIKIERFHSCYNFINTFIISLSIKGIISSALEASFNMMDDNLKTIIEGVKNLKDSEKLEYLKKFFPFDVYSLFLNFLSIYENQGGDVLQMSTYLVQETRNIEEYITSVNSSAKKNVVEFSILWLISIAILIILRFSLSSFYIKLINQPFFVISIGIFFVFVLISIEMLLRKITKIKIGGWNDSENYI